jgi:hypothetical protein
MSVYAVMARCIFTAILVLILTYLIVLLLHRKFNFTGWFNTGN